jgi:hypothetical protein
MPRMPSTDPTYAHAITTTDALIAELGAAA